jgi:hypothetical protein
MQFCDVWVRTYDKQGTAEVNLRVFIEKMRKVYCKAPREHIVLFSRILEKQNTINLILVCDKQGKILRQWPKTHSDFPTFFTEKIAAKKQEIEKIEFTINAKYDIYTT